MNRQSKPCNCGERRGPGTSSYWHTCHHCSTAIQLGDRVVYRPTGGERYEHALVVAMNKPEANAEGILDRARATYTIRHARPPYYSEVKVDRISPWTHRQFGPWTGATS